MKSLSKILRGSCAIVTSGALVFATIPAMAQDQPPPGAQLPPPGAQLPPPGEGQPAGPRLGQAELEKLLAPIALYPDDLVAQILTASTYPIEIVEATRWVHAHPNMHGDALADAMQQTPWDPSIKGLTAVPQVLAMMDDKLDWTQQLGEAFLAQPDDVSNAIQQLRAKAQANGNLRSSDKIRVSTIAPPAPPPSLGPVPVDVDPALLPPPPPPEYIVIEPYEPGVYYVPVYDPYVVYGPWLWPAYRPFYWYPPGYVVGAAVIGFSVGFFVGSALWCHYNWGGYGGGYGGGYYGWRGGGPVTINVVNYNRFNRTNIVAERGGNANWHFDAAHRGSVGFQNAALRQQFGEPRNFQNFQRTGTLPSNLQGTQQGNQFHGNQGQFNGKFQGNALQGNQSPGGSGPGNAKFNPNANLNPNAHVNTNANVNTNAHVNTNANVNTNAHVNTNKNVNTNANANINANINRDLNSNRNQNLNPNQNQNQNVNRNLNVNRNFNGGGGGGGGNPNRGANIMRNAGPPPGLGAGGGRGGPPGGGGGKGGGGGGGGKGGKPDDHGHH
jgi:Protein of unknown function (DUF3300)